MLFLLLTTVMYLCLFYGWGHFLLQLLRIACALPALVVLCGMVFCSVIFTLLAFFVPLSAGVELPLMILPLCYILFRQQKVNWKWTGSPAAIFWSVALAVLLGSFTPFVLDHYSYYVPSIRWLQTFGLIRGTAVADLMLGQMSAWHILQAGFGHIVDPYLRLNTVLLATFLIYVAEKRRYYMLLFAPLFFFFVQAPSPDLPVLVLTLIIGDWFLRTKEAERPELMIVLAAFAVLIKPTAFWLVLLFLPWAVRLGYRSRAFWYCFGVGLLLVVKNLVTFGYPVFPLSWFDLAIAWRPHPYLLEQSQRTGLSKSFDNQYPLETIASWNIWQRALHWWQLDGFKGYINILLTLLLIFSMILAVCQRSAKRLWLVTLLVLKTILVLYVSAQYRFMLDIVLIAGVLLFSNVKLNKIYLPVFLTSCVIFLVVLIFPAFLQNRFSSFKSAQNLLPPTLHQVLLPAARPAKSFGTHQIGNFRFQVPSVQVCYETPSPAITPEYLKDYLQQNIFPQWDQHTIRWKTLDTNESAALRQIINAWDRRQAVQLRKTPQVESH